jgi:hypothetical protein
MREVTREELKQVSGGSQPPGQLGYEGQPGNQGGGDGNNGNNNPVPAGATPQPNG